MIVVRRNTVDPVFSLDIFLFDEFKSRGSPFEVNLGFLEAVFLQPLFCSLSRRRHDSRSPFAVRRSQISERPYFGWVVRREAIIMVARFLFNRPQRDSLFVFGFLATKTGLFNSYFAKEPPYGGAVLRNRATGMATLLRKLRILRTANGKRRTAFIARTAR